MAELQQKLKDSTSCRILKDVFVQESAQAAAHSEALPSAYRTAYASDAFCVQRPGEAGWACDLLGESSLSSFGGKAVLFAACSPYADCSNVCGAYI